MAKVYRVRRMVDYLDGRKMEFLGSLADPISKSGLLWVPTYKEALTFSREEAEAWREEAELRCFNGNVLKYEVVE